MSLLTVKQLATLCHVEEQTIRRWVKEGKLPDRRIKGTRKLLFIKSDLPTSQLQIAA